MSFCCVGCCCCCLTLCRFLIFRLLFNVTGTSPWFLQPMNASTSSELFPHYFSFLAFVMLFFWLSFFSLKRFLPAPFSHIWCMNYHNLLFLKAFIKTFLEDRSSTSKAKEQHPVIWHIVAARLFFWITQPCWVKNSI